jgi:glutamyl-tRNA synthetase
MRGADLLPSTARQWLLQNALGLSHPEWFHVPLVVDGEGHRLAKRRDDLSLRALRDAGIDPRVIVAWTARSAGFDASDQMTATDLLSVFDLGRLSQAAPDEVFSALVS